MNDTHLYALIALTQENRRLINLAGAGVCLACEAISPAALIETYASDTAVCPQCGKDAMVPAWTTRLLDAVSHEVYGSRSMPQTPSNNDSKRTLSWLPSMARFSRCSLESSNAPGKS